MRVDIIPLCTAGHLSLRGGDRPAALVRKIAGVSGKASRSKLLISPRVRAMSGRIEGVGWAKRLTLALFIVFTLFATPALAVLPDEVLADTVLEARARALSAHLRCLVCQNQSIDDSNADLARDLRILVRERLTAGDTDDEVIDFVVARYGEFVLLRPRFSAENAILWATPVVLLLGGGAFALVRARRKQSTTGAPLTDEEKAALARIDSED